MKPNVRKPENLPTESSPGGSSSGRGPSTLTMGQRTEESPKSERRPSLLLPQWGASDVAISPVLGPGRDNAQKQEKAGSAKKVFKAKGKTKNSKKKGNNLLAAYAQSAEPDAFGTEDLVSASQVQLQALALLGLCAQPPAGRVHVNGADERRALATGGAIETVLALAYLKPSFGTAAPLPGDPHQEDVCDMAHEVLYQWPVAELTKYVGDRQVRPASK